VATFIIKNGTCILVTDGKGVHSCTQGNR